VRRLVVMKNRVAAQDRSQNRRQQIAVALQEAFEAKDTAGHPDHPIRLQAARLLLDPRLSTGNTVGDTIRWAFSSPLLVTVVGALLTALIVPALARKAQGPDWIRSALR
jgi:hypothetical protein